MVYRVYVEKREGCDVEARKLLSDIRSFLQIKNLEKIRVINRYDVENIEKELFEKCKTTVFSEPQTDDVSEEIVKDGACSFVVEALPGQYDQRADSAAQCIQIISCLEKPVVKTAKVYVLYGSLTDGDIAEIKKYLINPVEAREASDEKYETLAVKYDIPTEVAVIDGFIDMDEKGLSDFLSSYGLAMDLEDLKFCQAYFKGEKRNPTVTEIRMIDTYWSDHCRHTTFLTDIDNVTFEDKTVEKAYERYMEARKRLGVTKPVCLMNIATIAVKELKAAGKLDKLDESEEINACTVKIKVEREGKQEDWLLLFKNETHNHPTEIEPFGGAATCIGGAIRDPLSGRSYVYAAMRVTGAANPLMPVSAAKPGKLPQRKIVTTAAAGYSSYGNQIGLATGIVDEIYHEGYEAKRMEIGAVLGAAPQENVRRERPAPGDIVILLGGRTGRDGCGGATGSSKSHTTASLESCGAEVQKGNAPEERKLQRLFRNPEASKLIKRCNDFGAGGVSVAIGELADGLKIDLNAVKKKYDGLDGTELAISESQERMAVVVAACDEKRFFELADTENLEATVVAVVTGEERLVMEWNGKNIVDISRDFLNSNGASKHIDITVPQGGIYEKEIGESFTEEYKALADDLNICSKRGLSERFDSTIGAGTVLMPFGGKNQITPIQAMVNKLPVEKGDTTTCSLMAWGYNPYVSEKSPFIGAYTAVVESVCKLISAGAEFEDVYLTFQEYFEKPGKDGKRWGKPLAALLGAYSAQMDYEIGSIGGKDSMSGSFENIDVPPTLVSFAVTTEDIKNIISPEFKKAGNKVVVLKPAYDENGLPVAETLKENFKVVSKLVREGKAVSVYTPGPGGIAEAVMKMSFGNGIGFEYNEAVTLKDIFSLCYGAFVIELSEDADIGEALGYTTEEYVLKYKNEKLCLGEISKIYEDKLESVFSCNIASEDKKVDAFEYKEGKISAPAIKVAKPKVLIPVFPGTNCEYDSAKAVERAGAEAEIFVINNLTSEGISKSAESFAKKAGEAQIIFIPGGFSGGDEPDGSGKFITAFFRNEGIKEKVTELLERRDGLMCGICNGFQALIKLGLVPYGKIVDATADSPTLTYNTIGRHQSKIVRVKVCTNNSPWLKKTNVGEVYSVPISHGEGRFIADEKLVLELAAKGQIATQYCDLSGNPTMDVAYNPNGSVMAVEGILSPDGRVIGKMGHSERIGKSLYKNVPGEYDMKLFESAVEYYK